MSRKKIPSKLALIDALKEADGNMASVGRKYHVDRRTVWHMVNDDPELRELVDSLQETFIDEAESQLYKHIREGNVVATIFFLKTKARHRGYSEKFEITAITQHQIEVDLGLSREDNQADAIDADLTPTALLEQ